jgi:hypothetical protein
MNDYERRVVANVAKYGWHCTSVSFKQGDVGTGFAHAILGILADAAAAGEMYALDKPCDALVENYECVFVEVPRARFNDYVLSASWFYAGCDFPLYQVV